jgi:hypothetical protein
MAPDDDVIWNNKLESARKKAIVANLRYYPFVYLKRITQKPRKPSVGLANPKTSRILWNINYLTGTFG